VSNEQEAAARGRQSGGLAFRLGGIPVSMPWSSLLGVALIAYLWNDSIRVDRSDAGQVVLWSLVFALLFYLSILGHELAHAWAARAFGLHVERITLWFLGGWTSYERGRPSAWREAVIAASGPISSVLIGLAWLWLGRGPLAGSATLSSTAQLLGAANIFLGAWNALPGLPLDGGGVLRSIVWGVTKDENRGTVVAAWAGRLVAVFVFAVPFLLAWWSGRRPDLVSIVFSGMIAAYLFAGASDALKRARLMSRVPALQVRALVRPAVVVPHDLPLSEALRRLDESGARAVAVADGAGHVVAVAQEDAVSAVPLERRPWVPVSSVSTTLDPAARLHLALGGDLLLRAMQDVPATDYAVHDDTGTVVGILTTKDVEKALGV
jgi:Zn-dependent protease